MQIELMRQVDYYLGVPLCFLLSGANYLARLFSFQRNKTVCPRKILLIKLSEMGGIILAYPLIKKMQEEFPRAEIHFLTFQKNKPLFELWEAVPPDNLLTIREGPSFAFITDTFRVINRLRKEGIDLVFDLEFFSRFSAILSYLSGSAKRIGFYHYSLEGLYRGNLLTHKVAYNSMLHISKTYLSLAQRIKNEFQSDQHLYQRIEDKDLVFPGVSASEKEKVLIRDRLQKSGIGGEQKIILINPGDGNLVLREWPLENFIRLCEKILGANNKYAIIIIGTGQSSLKAEAICRRFTRPRLLNLTNQTSLREIIALFDISLAFIANDCGLAHLAALTAIKEFVLFGPESPQVFGPRAGNVFNIYSGLACSPCFSVLNHRNSSCSDNRCLKIITPDEVYGMIKKELELL